MTCRPRPGEAHKFVHGDVPAAQAVNPAFRTPTEKRGLRRPFTHGALVVVLAVSDAFGELAVLSTLVTLIGYIGGCVAAVVLQRRGVADEGATLNFPFTEAAAAVGVVSMVWIAAQETWQEVLCGLGRGWGRESCLLGLAQADRTHSRLGSVALLTNQPFQSRPMSPNSEG
jgi:hypothetical protein